MFWCMMVISGWWRGCQGRRRISRGARGWVQGLDLDEDYGLPEGVVTTSSSAGGTGTGAWPTACDWSVGGVGEYQCAYCGGDGGYVEVVVWIRARRINS